MVEDERSDPAPTKQVGDRLIYLSRNFGELRGVPREPKISDFGLAVPSPGPHYHPIQPDLFQAPEVILCAGWSFPADIWNLGVMVSCQPFLSFHAVYKQSAPTDAPGWGGYIRYGTS